MLKVVKSPRLKFVASGDLLLFGIEVVNRLLELSAGGGLNLAAIWALQRSPPAK